MWVSLADLKVEHLFQCAALLPGFGAKPLPLLINDIQTWLPPTAAPSPAAAASTAAKASPAQQTLHAIFLVETKIRKSLTRAYDNAGIVQVRVCLYGCFDYAIPLKLAKR